MLHFSSGSDGDDDGDGGLGDWTPENYAAEVVDCLLRQGRYQSQDDLVAVIGTNEG